MNLYYDIWAVIISYNPNFLNLKNLINQLNKQNVGVIVVDNGSTNSFLMNELGCELIKLGNNKGIAIAQNKGIEWVIDNGGKYIIFFDQDSSISEGYVKNIFEDYQLLKSQKVSVGTIGPRFIDERYGFFYKTVNISKYGFRDKIDVSGISQPKHSALLISSGSLVSIDTLTHVGFMRENYFIDYVDTEWCIRAESKGCKNYISAKATMRHTIGDNVLQFKYFNVPVHSSFRRYYRVRNAYYMLREPHVPKLLAFREIIFNFVHQLILVFFEKDKKGYMKSYLKGCVDGIFKYERN